MRFMMQVWPWSHFRHDTGSKSGVPVGMLGLLLPGFLYAQPGPKVVAAEASSVHYQQRATENPLTRRTSILIEGLSLREALRTLGTSAAIKLTFGDEVSSVAKVVTVRAKDQTVESILQTILAGTAVKFRVTETGQILLFKEKQNSEQKDSSGSIRGRVVDSATGKGISGVTVSVDGMKLSTLTSENGMYTLPNVSVGTQTVHWRLVGYRSVTRSVTVLAEKSVTTNIIMTASATLLSGVVTSVTGTQQKREIGTDVTSIDVPDVLRTAPISNMTDLLQTRVPGLTVVHSSGVPGAPSRLRLRGATGGFYSGVEGAPDNDPIVIVDGIRIEASQSGAAGQSLVRDSRFPPSSAIDQIDVNSIEKVDVYKGPSATALYGSDAANGVIVITTKRGQAGPTKWNLTASQDLQYLPGIYAAPGFYLRSRTNVGCQTEKPCTPADALANMYNGFMIDSVFRFQALNESRLTPFGTGSGNTVTATVSGGAQSVTYSITGTTSQTLGLIKMPSLYQDVFREVTDSAAPRWMRRPNLLRTQGVNARFSIEPHPGLRAMFSARLTGSKQRQSSAQSQLSDLSGRYIDTIGFGLAELGGYVTRVDANQLVSDFSLQLDWNRWRFLPLAATTGVSRSNREETRLVPRGFPASGVSPNSPEGTGLGGWTNGVRTSTKQTGQLNGIVFPGRIVATAVGVQITKSLSQSFSASADSLFEGVAVPVALPKGATRSRMNSATGGWFIEPRLNLSSRFFANPGFRFDGGGNSGARSGWRNGFWSLFPKLNFSWIAVDRENEKPLFGAISMFRPRFAFGIAGVQPAPTWRLRLMQPPSTSLGIESGLRLSTMGNTQLRPERTQEVEFGGDLELWRDRMTVGITHFVKIRNDAILQTSLPPSVGSGSANFYTNIGRVRNTGTELSFSFIPLDHPMLRWTVHGSLSKFTNVLVSLNQDSIGWKMADGSLLRPGYPLYGRWERPILGWSPPTNGGHLTKEAVVVGDSAVYMGPQEPNFTLPFQVNVSSLRGLLTLNVSFQYQDGLTQMNAGGKDRLANIYFDPASSLAEQAAALMAMIAQQIDKTSVGTLYGVIQQVNTFRFQSFSIGYTVPRTFARRLRASSLSFALQGSNLGLWTNYRGKDPVVNSVTLGDQTRDDGQLPAPRNWRFQVRVGN